VNEHSPRYKDVIVTDKNYIIDNVENILSNKITAIMGRDNPKDIFDIFLISKFFFFSWEHILESAHKKANFNHDELITRLQSFPKELLNNIQMTDPDILLDFDQEFPLIVNQIREL